MSSLLDLICSACGYSLQGLERTGNCPECGQPIARSIAERRSHRKRIDRKVVAVGGLYVFINILAVFMLMKADPFQIFDVWPVFVLVGPLTTAVAAIAVWCWKRNFHWITLMVFVAAMVGIAWLNFEFVSACSAAV